MAWRIAIIFPGIMLVLVAIPAYMYVSAPSSRLNWENTSTNTNTKYTCDTGQTRNKETARASDNDKPCRNAFDAPDKKQWTPRGRGAPGLWVPQLLRRAA